MKAIEVAKELNVLVSCVQGQLYATSAKCTHYGAPLVNGVLDSSGCVTCPWHGAKFHVQTGDIEDAPALDALYSFRVEVEQDGSVFVNVDQEAAKANNRRPQCVKGRKATGAEKAATLVIGGGAAATSVTQALRENGFDGAITIVSSEAYLPIDRTKLSKALIDDPEKVQLRDASFFADLGIDVRTGLAVEKIDPKAKSVKLSDGSSLTYERLICASGGSPKKLPLDGVDLENVFVLRTIEHTKAINAALGDGKSDKKNLVIIGTSWIGLEAAIASAERANVQVVGMDEAPFQSILGKEVGNALRKNHEKKGIKFAMQAELSHLEPSKSDKSKVGTVHLKDGTSFPADVVLLAVGVAPRTEYLADHVELNKDKSVNVDKHFAVEGLSDVYAIGDIASYIDANTNSRYRIEHWNVAQGHGRVLASNLTGKPQVYDKVPYFWSAQGAQLRYAGTSEAPGWEDSFTTGNPDELKFAAYYTKADRIVAVATMGTDPLVSHSSNLLRLGKMPSAKDVRGGLDPLSIQI